MSHHLSFRRRLIARSKGREIIGRDGGSIAVNMNLACTSEFWLPTVLPMSLYCDIHPSMAANFCPEFPQTRVTSSSPHQRQSRKPKLQIHLWLRFQDGANSSIRRGAINNSSNSKFSPAFHARSLTVPAPQKWPAFETLLRLPLAFTISGREADSTL